MSTTPDIMATAFQMLMALGIVLGGGYLLFIIF